MTCLKCNGLLVAADAWNESFKRFDTMRCVNCGQVIYPPQPLVPLLGPHKKGGRAGVPMFNRPKKMLEETD